MKSKAISLLLILGLATALGACQSPTSGDTGTQSNPATRSNQDNNKTKSGTSPNHREDTDDKPDSSKHKDKNDRDENQAPAKSQ